MLFSEERTVHYDDLESCVTFESTHWNVPNAVNIATTCDCSTSVILR